MTDQEKALEEAVMRLDRRVTETEKQVDLVEGKLKRSTGVLKDRIQALEVSNAERG